MEPSTPNFPALLSSWRLSMQAERKSPHTIVSYVRGAKLYLEWYTGLAGDGQILTDTHRLGAVPGPLSRPSVQRWIAELLDKGAEPATAVARLHALRQFSAWLANPDQGEIETDHLLGLKSPKIDQKVIDGLTGDEIKLLLKVCSGRDFMARRDEAAVRLLAECGLRAGELVALKTTDIDLEHGLVTVTRGKGGKGRVVAIGAQTSAALDRYLRSRAMHRLAPSPPLFLGGGSNQANLGYHGLRVALRARAEAAGIENFHLHRLRHAFASRWLASGGTEGGLMAAAGWTSRDMIDRYSRHTASERSQAEARRLQLGDL
jgi:integrase